MIGFDIRTIIYILNCLFDVNFDTFYKILPISNNMFRFKIIERNNKPKQTQQSFFLNHDGGGVTRFCISTDGWILLKCKKITRIIRNVGWWCASVTFGATPSLIMSPLVLWGHYKNWDITTMTAQIVYMETASSMQQFERLAYTHTHIHTHTHTQTHT